MLVREHHRTCSDALAAETSLMLERYLGAYLELPPPDGATLPAR